MKNRVCFALVAWLLPCAAAAQQPPAPAQGAPSQTPAQQAGEIPLPQGPPPTGLQAPVPRPARAPQAADRPALTSPSLAGVLGRVPDRPITIDEAVAIALSANRSLALANTALLRAQGRASETSAAFNPTLNGGFTYTRLNQGQSFVISGHSVTLVNPDQPVFTMQVSMPVDIFGLLRAAATQAHFQEIAARLDLNRTLNDTVSAVKSSFYDVLRAQALVAVATENLRDSLDRLSDAQKRFRAGVVARFDVTRAQTDVANAQQQLIQARSQVSVAIAALNNNLGLNIDTPLQVTDQGAVEMPPGVPPPSAPTLAPEGANGAAAAPGAAPPPLPAGQAPAPTPAAPLAPNAPAQTAAPTVVYDPLDLGPEYRTALDEALRTRPDILEQEASIAAARQGITLARRAQLPTLAVSGGGTYNPNAAGFSPITMSGQIVAALNIPIYEGGVTRGRVEQARADVATAEINRRQALDLVTLDVRQAYINLIQARDRVAVSNQALAQARESFRLARVRYNAGVSSQAGISPLLEVSDAQAALTQAESNQVSALYDYNNARSQLDHAIGRYSYQPFSKAFTAPPGPRVTGFTAPRTTTR